MDKLSAPAYTFAKKYARSSKATPGPSDYEFNHALERKSPACLLGKSAKLIDKNQNVPGPGTYDIRNDYPAKTISFGGKNADISRQKQQNITLPGPGQYNPSDSYANRNSPMYSMGSKISPKQIEMGPGPNSYSIDEATKRGVPSATIGKAKRQPDLNIDSPGPFSYNTFEKRNLGGGKIGKSLRLDNNQQKEVGPGPGQYNLTSRQKRGFSIGVKPSSGIVNETPGPGFYNSIQKSRVRSFKIGKALRMEDLKESQMPGPGFYKTNNTLMSSTGGKIGRSQRKPNLAGQVNFPGPGAYSVGIKKGRVISIPKGANQLHNQTMPGPGDYSPISSKKLKSAPFGRSKRFEQDINGLGPGYYTITQQKRGGVKFGKQERLLSRSSERQSPGYYLLPSTVSNLPQYAKRKAD